MCVAVNKAKRSSGSEEHIDIDTEIQSLEFSQLVFGLALVQYFLTMLPFGIVMHTLCHVSEGCDLIFCFDFTGN